MILMQKQTNKNYPQSDFCPMNISEREIQAGNKGDVTSGRAEDLSSPLPRAPEPVRVIKSLVTEFGTGCP